MKLTVEILKVGHCSHPEKIVYAKGKMKARKFPANVFLIKHPGKGSILFDTGYANRFYEVTKKLPEKLYAIVTPVILPEAEQLVVQLQKKGLTPEQIFKIIISHFHADHVAGLKDFPAKNVICCKKSLQNLLKLGRFKQVTKGFLKELIPKNWQEEFSCISEVPIVDTGLKHLPVGGDILGDKSIISIALPGHMEGHFGVFLPKTNMGPLLLAGDAFWTAKNLMENVMPHSITSFLQHDYKQYKETLNKLSLTFNDKAITIIGCHCDDEEVVALTQPEL